MPLSGFAPRWPAIRRSLLQGLIWIRLCVAALIVVLAVGVFFGLLTLPISVRMDRIERCEAGTAVTAAARPPMAALPTARSSGVLQAATDSGSALAAMAVMIFLIGLSPRQKDTEPCTEPETVGASITAPCSAMGEILGFPGARPERWLFR